MYVKKAQIYFLKYWWNKVINIHVTLILLDKSWHNALNQFPKKGIVRLICMYYIEMLITIFLPKFFTVWVEYRIDRLFIEDKSNYINRKIYIEICILFEVIKVLPGVDIPWVVSVVVVSTATTAKKKNCKWKYGCKYY